MSGELYRRGRLRDSFPKDRWALGTEWAAVSYLQTLGKGNGSRASKVIPTEVKLRESGVFCQGRSKYLS